MFVKVCGITNRADALNAVDAGAGALGFIFHPQSLRAVNPNALREWIEDVPRGIRRVGVFVDRPPAEIERVVKELRLDVAQLHGSETVREYPRGVSVWKAFRVARTLPAEARGGLPVDAILLDGSNSGETFDWSLAAGFDIPVILAGGLNESNVERAIEQVQPWGVDVCSSLEISPGRKDRAKVARFIRLCQPTMASQN